MTKFIDLTHSTHSRIHYKVNQPIVESTIGCKVKEGKTYHAAGLSHFTRLKSSVLVDFTKLKRRPARVRQARQVPVRAMPGQGLYTGVGAGKLELELELKIGAEAGAEETIVIYKE